MWTVHWSRHRLDDQDSWASETGISTEPKALGVVRAMLLKGWTVYAISKGGKSIWDEARISERCGKPMPIPVPSLDGFQA